jgi:hypothetical protein
LIWNFSSSSSVSPPPSIWSWVTPLATKLRIWNFLKFLELFGIFGIHGIHGIFWNFQKFWNLFGIFMEFL